MKCFSNSCRYIYINGVHFQQIIVRLQILFFFKLEFEFWHIGRDLSSNMTEKIYKDHCIVGSPIISEVKRAIDGQAENSSTYVMNVISLPKAPRSGIMIEYKNGPKLKINCSKVVPATFPYYMHGRVLDVNGYQMAFEIEKVTEKWLNEFTVYVDNDFGEHGFKVVLEESKLKLNTFGIIFSFFFFLQKIIKIYYAILDRLK